MKTANFILSGLGGQGVLFLTKVLAQAAVNKGFSVMGAETHGMAQRGGSVVSHLRVGDVGSSLVMAGSAHYVLALEENEAYRNIPFLAKAGGLYANARQNRFPRQEVGPYLKKMGIVCRSLPAGEMAMELDAPMSLNLALLGFFSSFGEGPVSHKDLSETIEQITPNRFKAINLKVFDAGFQRGVKEQSGE